MQNRCSLVTGGARRVGRAIALRLARGGFDVAITYFHSADHAADAVREIQSLGRRAEAIRADLTDVESAIAEIVRQVQSSFGQLDLLVNNASIYEPTDFSDVDLASLRQMLAIHVEAPLLLSQRLAPLLKTSHGTIINLVDHLAERPWPAYMGYCASKAALANLTLSLARQLAPQVTVNGIAPGVVEWPDNFPQEQRNKYLSRVPLGRPGTPEDVAELVYFLATTGRYITGQIIRLDGGRSIT